MKIGFLILLGTFLFSACASLPASGLNFGNQFATNGERIYFTDRNEDGQYIAYSGGSSQRGMMGGAQLNCASCHGDEGRGGKHLMHMTSMDAPDIRYSVLSGEVGTQNDEHGEDGEHVLAHAAYDLKTFRSAVVYGEHPGGDPLDIEMPRWRFNDSDLFDLFTYIKSLD